MHKWDGPQSFPYVITIFSAPNYCGYYDNKAAVLIVNESDLSLKQFEETDPPYRLPGNMDVFEWSVPFLAQKVMNMLLNVDSFQNCLSCLNILIATLVFA